MNKYKGLTKEIKQKTFNSIKVEYGVGLNISQSGHYIVLDKVGARKLIKELEGYVND